MPEGFELALLQGGFQVYGVGARRGSMFGTTITAIWERPEPIERRIEVYLESVASRLQRFVSNSTRQPWPSGDAITRTRVDDDGIALWWGGPEEATARVKIQPISWSEVRCDDASADHIPGMHAI
ncbi:MAG: hypothetical protein ACYDA6_10830 [Solirubrobacteraceae bacterium]